jgi:hypothetical protein
VEKAIQYSTSAPRTSNYTYLPSAVSAARCTAGCSSVAELFPWASAARRRAGAGRPSLASLRRGRHTPVTPPPLLQPTAQAVQHNGSVYMHVLFVKAGLPVDPAHPDFQEGTAFKKVQSRWQRRSLRAGRWALAVRRQEQGRTVRRACRRTQGLQRTPQRTPPAPCLEHASKRSARSGGPALARPHPFSRFCGVNQPCGCVAQHAPQLASPAASPTQTQTQTQTQTHPRRPGGLPAPPQGQGWRQPAVWGGRRQHRGQLAPAALTCPASQPLCSPPAASMASSPAARPPQGRPWEHLAAAWLNPVARACLAPSGEQGGGEDQGAHQLLEAQHDDRHDRPLPALPQKEHPPAGAPPPPLPPAPAAVPGRPLRLLPRTRRDNHHCDGGGHAAAAHQQAG